MCVDGDNLDSRIWKNYKINMDLGSKLVFMHEHVMNNQEHVMNI